MFVNISKISSNICQICLSIFAKYLPILAKISSNIRKNICIFRWLCAKSKLNPCSRDNAVFSWGCCGSALIQIERCPEQRWVKFLPLTFKGLAPWSSKIFAKSKPYSKNCLPDNPDEILSWNNCLDSLDLNIVALICRPFQLNCVVNRSVAFTVQTDPCAVCGQKWY